MDALNPWGDVLAIARCWCVAHPRAWLLLAVPFGVDQLEFNAQRWYGPLRYPLLATNWRLLRGPAGALRFGGAAFNQTVFVFRRTNGTCKAESGVIDGMNFEL